MSSPLADWRKWIEKGDNDRLDIRNNLNSDQIPYDVVTYHAQQAAEKYLKAFLAFHGTRPPYVHDLRTLLEQCVVLNSSLLALENDCRTIDYHAEDIRYPAVLDEDEEQIAHEAVAASDRICSTIIEAISK